MLVSDLSKENIKVGMRVFYKDRNRFGKIINVQDDMDYSPIITIRWENGFEEAHRKEWFCATTVIYDHEYFFLSMRKCMRDY